MRRVCVAWRRRPNALLRDVVLVVAVVVLDAVQEPVPAVGARGHDDAVVVRVLPA